MIQDPRLIVTARIARIDRNATKKPMDGQVFHSLQARKALKTNHGGPSGLRRMANPMTHWVRQYPGSRAVGIGLLFLALMSPPIGQCSDLLSLPNKKYSARIQQQGTGTGIVVKTIGEEAEDGNKLAAVINEIINAFGGTYGLVSISLQDPNYPGSIGAGTNLRFDGTNFWLVGWQDQGDGTPVQGVRIQVSGDFSTIGPVTPLGSLGGDASFATDVSADGSVVGFSRLADGVNDHAFVWTETGGMADLASSTGPSGFSRAFGVSADGSVVVGEEGDAPFGLTRPFVWTAAGGFQDLSTGLGTAYAVSADGSVVVGQANYPSTAFVWTQAGGMQNLGSLPGYSWSVATGISDDGQVVVGFAAPRPISRDDALGFNSGNDCRPFVWTAATGMQDLNQLLANAGEDLTGITLFALSGISTDGQIVSGICRTPANDPTDANDVSGFIARLPQ